MAKSDSTSPQSLSREPLSREPLSREAIVDAAIALADEGGIKALSMRKLATSLGFEVMSLYNHVSNKNELCGLMVDVVARDIADVAPTAEPLKQVRSIALATRSVLVAHRWSAELWLQHLPGPARARQMEALLSALAESGLRPDLAHYGFHAVTNHILGYTLQEQGMNFDKEEPVAAKAIIDEYLGSLSADTHPHSIAHIHQHIDGESGRSFEFVLDLILDGLQRVNSDS